MSRQPPHVDRQPRTGIYVLLGLLKHATRRDVILRLAHGSATRAELSQVIGVPSHRLDHHLQRLMANQLVMRNRTAGRMEYKLGARASAIAGRETLIVHVQTDGTPPESVTLRLPQGEHIGGASRSDH